MFKPNNLKSSAPVSSLKPSCLPSIWILSIYLCFTIFWYFGFVYIEFFRHFFVSSTSATFTLRLFLSHFSLLFSSFTSQSKVIPSLEFSTNFSKCRKLLSGMSVRTPTAWILSFWATNFHGVLLDVKLSHVVF